MRKSTCGTSNKQLIGQSIRYLTGKRGERYRLVMNNGNETSYKHTERSVKMSDG